MHIEVRKQGKKKKYYLSQSYRHKRKVKKTRVYLGADLSKKELKKLEAKGKIKMLGLNEQAWLKFTEKFVYDTNAIEGSKLTRKEVKAILRKKNPIINQIKKRDGRVVTFNREKIANAIFKAAQAIGGRDRKEAERVTDKVIEYIHKKFKARGSVIPSVEQVQDLVVKALIDTSHKRTADVYANYRKRRAIEREVRKQIGIADDLKLALNAIEVLERRYLLRDEQGRIVETPRQLFARVARHIAGAEKAEERAKIEKQFYEMLLRLEFLPNTPTLMNAGTELGQLSACFILHVPDDLRGIFDSVRDAALIHQSGGGTGFSFSHLRPEGDFVKSTQGVASGPISFMTVFDKATYVIKQGSKRRGANMAILHVSHPDIEEFIKAKQTPGVLENFNVSVAADDKFMHAVEKNQNYDLINPRTKRLVRKINARKLFNQICKSAWLCAEPGMFFIDLANRDNPTPKFNINATNPCAEVPMPDYESCNLGSIVLDKFADVDWSNKNWKEKIDWARLRSTVRLAIRFLDNVVELNKYPLVQIREMTLNHRRLGLGVMGFARLLTKLGIRYNSKSGYEVGESIMKFINDEARQMSYELGKERGNFPGFKYSTWAKKYGAMRNATVTSIAPTGTISMIANTSSGIEPLYALSYVKTVMEGTKLYYNDEIFQYILYERNLYSKELINKIIKRGTIHGMKELPKDIRDVFIVAYDIPPEAHVKMQAVFQKHVDLAVSKTINLPANAKVKDVERAYMLAWKLGCKGITIYRDTSRSGQVLSIFTSK